MTIIYTLIGIAVLVALVFLAFASYVSRIYREIDLEFDLENEGINSSLCDYDDHMWEYPSLINGNVRICIRCGKEQRGAINHKVSEQSFIIFQ